MKKIVLFFVTFFLSFLYSNFQSVTAETEIKSFTPAIGITHISDDLYNSDVYLYKLVSPSSGYGLFLFSLFDKNGNSIGSTYCTESALPNGYCFGYTKFSFINYDVITLYGYYYGSYSGPRYTYLILDKNSKRIVHSQGFSEYLLGQNNVGIFYKNGTIYIKQGGNYRSLSDTEGATIQTISSNSFNYFYTTYNKNFYYNPKNSKFYELSGQTVTELTFSDTTYNSFNYNLSQAYSSKKSSNMLFYKDSLFISEESTTGELHTLTCSYSGVLNCLVDKDVYSLFYNSTSGKGYKITKTDYNTVQPTNLYNYFGYKYGENIYYKGYVKNDKLYYDFSTLSNFSTGPASGGNIDLDLPSNCYVSKSYNYEKQYDISLSTENLNNYSIDVGNNYLDYTNNTTNKTYGLVYYNSTVKYKNSIGVEQTGSGINVLFNTGSYIDITTDFLGESSLYLYYDDSFNELTLSCNDTAKTTFVLYTSQDSEVTDLNKEKLFLESDGFGCNQKINFDEPVSMVKIVMKGFKKNYKINDIILKKNKNVQVNDTICYDPNTGGYTKNGNSFVPTDEELNEIGKNIDIGGGNTYFQKIFGGFGDFLDDFFSPYIIVLPSTPKLTYSIPIPTINNHFKPVLQEKTFVISPIEDRLGVSTDLNSDSNNGKYFIVFFLTIIYIIVRLSIIGLIFFLFYLYWVVLNKFTTNLLGSNFTGNSVGSNAIGVVVFTGFLTVVITSFAGLFTYITPLNSVFNVGIDVLNIIFTFFSFSLGNYNLFYLLTNTFFGFIVAGFTTYLVWILTLKFGRLN